MATLRELIIKVSANSQSFQTEIARASRMGADYYKTMQNGGRQAAAASKDTRRALSELTDQMESAKSSAMSLAGAFAGAFATGHLISLADEWNSVNARLKQASQSTDDFSSSQRLLMDISQKTGTAFSDNANLFSRSAASMREFGYSSTEVLQITEAISTGLKLSGANAQESSSVITQFSQALAQGVLRGEEFNAVNESGDRVIRALAAGMGVARKDLKAMADQGKLTIDKVVPALISQLGKLRDEYGELPQTVSSSATKIENAFMQWVGGANEASGATRTLTGVLNGVAENIDSVATAAGVLVAVGVSRYFGGMVTGAYSATAGIINAAKSEVALAEAQVRGTQISTARARAAVYRAQQALAAARGTDAQTVAENRLSLAQASLSRNIAARASAQTALNTVTSVGARLMGGALGLVGGIPGLVLLGAGAWYTMYQNQEQARRSAQDYAKTIDEVSSKTKTMSLPEAADNESKTRQALEEQNRLVDAQSSKVKSLKEEIAGYQYVLSNPGPTTGNGFMINHLTSVETVTRGLEDATAALAVEQERLSQMQAKSESIQSVLEGLENRRVALIRQQAAEQNAAYQSLMIMNGQHTEFNRLLGLGNNLLMARQGLVNAPMRIPQADLTTQQQTAIEKSRRDLELSKLKGETKERARLGYVADDLGLTADDPKYQTGRQSLINNGLAEWQNNEANKPKRKGPKTDEEKAEDVYKRLLKQQREQIALSSQNTELAKVKYQVTQGELASLEQAKKETLLQNAALIDQKNIAEQLKTFREGQADSNAAARDRGNIDFLGAGMGDKARDRMKEMADIRSDFLKQQRDLQRDFSKGQISEDLYKQQTEALKTALDERLAIQEEYYEKADEQQKDWRSGMMDSLIDYADEAANLSQIAADATTAILDGATSEVAEGFKSMIDGSKSVSESLSDAFEGLGNVVIDTLVKMGAQWLVYQAVQLMVGKAAQAEAGSTMFANAQATALQAQLAAYASTAAIPVFGPAMAPAAAGAAAAFTEPLAAAVGALSLAGMAHDGIDRVPETGTWLLQKGERVVTASTSAKLDDTLSKVQQARQDSGAGGYIHIQNSYTGKPDDATLAAIDQRNERLVRDIRRDMAQQVIKPSNEFGRALHNRYVRGYKE
ncbi:phage tail tape measure protein [Raoultella ornithinolytica]|uniref:phage tail tape measure protein n=1 Tax=Raoultella ornithinolytica TaxID=54291 RepID=UPI0025B2E3DE|nr:phage tail tape measure protein [Raoultella ornithinolytica]MDN3781119.1 phage tail tape measure protein [Raoultella ornithinolytica]